MNEKILLFTRELAANPHNRNAYLRLGDAFQSEGMPVEAVAVYDRALALWPEFGEAHNNRGNALLELGRYREAIDCYLEAIRLLPGFVEGYVTIATALMALHRPYEAMASCHRALAADPECAEAHWNLALALLQVGEYSTGWDELEWRWKKKGFTSRKRSFPKPMWNGEPLDGRTILIHAEQGFGDTFQFARFFPMAAERGGRVMVECPAPLKRLIRETPGVAGVVAAGKEDIPPFDVHLPVMSLARVFGASPENLPADVPYIYPELATVAEWLSRVGTGNVLRVGLVWEGRKKPDPNRTCPVENLSPLARMNGVAFYSLQMGEKAYAKDAANAGLAMTDLTSHINDFADTAALITQLDLVISIDTAVAHLAGALGKETWVMLPHAADWRWMLDRRDSPWYPSMRLFRQESPGGWQGVIKSLKEELAAKISYRSENMAVASPEMEAEYSRGLAGLRQGSMADAKIHLLRALIANPRIPEVYNALGVLCRETGDMKSARLFLEHAVRLDPQYTDGYINLGNVLYGEGLNGEAEAAFRHAISFTPGDARAHQNLGVVLQASGRLTEADASFMTALSLQPGYATARWNMAVLKLLRGQLRQGFEEFEARFAKNDPVPGFHSDRPLWDGAPFPGKTLLVHAEQGFGDTFQFIRYFPMVKERGGRVLFECQEGSLREILESMIPKGDLFVRGEKLPYHDMQVPLLSLPRVFQTTESSIPAAVPYLFPPREKIEPWKMKINGDEGFRVGLVWAGRPKPDPRRSASLELLAPLGEIPGVTFHSLQVGEGAEQILEASSGLNIRDWSGDLTDFSATAALIDNLDLVITIDSAVAHLAGAMGRPVWLMLPFAPDWRWMLGRSDCPWYPTMRLFRQPVPGDWQSVVENMANELRIASEDHRKTDSVLPGINPAGMAAGLTESGFEWLESRRLDQAEFCFRKAVALAPHFVPAFSGLARSLASRGKTEEAENIYQEILDQDPRNINALAGLGAIFSGRGEHRRAVASLRAAHLADPENAEVMRQLAEALSFSGEQEDAAALLEKTVNKEPGNMGAMLNLGIVLTYLERYDEAGRIYERYLKERPDDARGHNLLGVAMQKEDRLEEAAACFEKALAIDPAYLHALNNYGSVLSGLGRTGSAARKFRKALELDPSYHDARWNLSLASLRMGDYPGGWRYYDSRWHKTNPVERRKFAAPEWDGKAVAGETLLVCCEQGYGDTFQFIRFAETIRPMCGRLVVECQTTSIKGLTGRARGVDEVITRDDDPPEFHKYCSLLDIPALIGLTADTIPASAPYLFADPDLVKTWNDRLGQADMPRIGLVWAGRPEHEDDRHRSIPLRKLEPLLDVAGVRFLSLQVGQASAQLKEPGNEKLVDLGATITGYEDTAAIIENLDLLISVDTSVVHLGGALAKPVWVILPFAPDWRWMEKREDSPWYPSMRLYRQPGPGDWESVVERLRADLANCLFRRHADRPGNRH